MAALSPREQICLDRRLRFALSRNGRGVQPIRLFEVSSRTRRRGLYARVQVPPEELFDAIWTRA